MHNGWAESESSGGSARRCGMTRNQQICCALAVVGTAFAYLLTKSNPALDPFASHEMTATSSELTLNKKRVRAIQFIGERHTGTNWIFKHLVECFGHGMPVEDHLARFKHWFQFEDRSKILDDVLVIAQFRNVYDWVEAMRELPYHSPLHDELEWHDFVTKEWSMPRWGDDLEITDHKSRICGQRFTFDEVVPCDGNLFHSFEFRYHPRYELNHDGSGRPYKSIVDLRADKIRNFLEISEYEQVVEFWPVQYEYFVINGTQHLLDRIEEVSGIRPQCKAFTPQSLHRKSLAPAFRKWLQQNVDWTAEGLVGYRP